MSDITLHMSVAARNVLHTARKRIEARVGDLGSERGEGVVGYLLALLLVIAGVALVRPIILDMLQSEAEAVDLDLSGGDPSASDDG